MEYLLRYQGRDIARIFNVEKDFPTYIGSYTFVPNWDEGIDEIVKLYVDVALGKIDPETIEEQHFEQFCLWLTNTDCWTMFKMDNEVSEDILPPTITKEYIAWR